MIELFYLDNFEHNEMISNDENNSVHEPEPMCLVSAGGDNVDAKSFFDV